jgi:hypothetical protein
MGHISGMEGMIERVLDRAYPLPAPSSNGKQSSEDDVSSIPIDSKVKCKCLEKKQAQLMKTINFMKSLGEDYKGKYESFLLVSAELEELEE